jgi:alpha-maltose-1-phosphate synthase
VFPSLTEGFGRVTLEAMACGIPVITTENARGIVEDGKTGFVVPIRDAKALAEKIQYLYDNREIASEMGRQARLAVEKKKPFGEAVYEIYQEILKREGKSL